MGEPLMGLQCATCRHQTGMVRTEQPEDREGLSQPACKAFPKGIPLRIIQDEFDHRRPHLGDHGVRWEPVNAEAAKIHSDRFSVNAGA